MWGETGKYLFERHLLRDFALCENDGVVQVKDEFDAPQHFLILVVEVCGVVLSSLQRGRHDLERYSAEEGLAHEILQVVGQLQSEH